MYKSTLPCRHSDLNGRANVARKDSVEGFTFETPRMLESLSMLCQNSNRPNSSVPCPFQSKCMLYPLQVSQKQKAFRCLAQVQDNTGNTFSTGIDTSEQQVSKAKFILKGLRIMNC